MTVHIYDVSNWLRIRYESNQSLEDICFDLLNTVGTKILVYDGFKSTGWRKGLFPEYKGNRKPAVALQDWFDTLNLFKKQYVPAMGDVFTVEVAEYEADDLIAFLAKDTKGFIYSSDQDFLVLESPNMRCVSPYVSKIRVPAVQMRLYKTLTGDSSDNIIGLQGFGPKSFDRLSDFDIRLLNHAFELGDSAPFCESLPERFQVKLEENWEQLKVFWTIIGFRPITADVVRQHLKFHPKGDMTKVMALNVRFKI